MLRASKRRELKVAGETPYNGTKRCGTADSVLNGETLPCHSEPSVVESLERLGLDCS